MHIERIGKIIIRTPISPLKNIYQHVCLDSMVEDDAFLCAVYIASPVLYEEVLSYKKGGVKSDNDKRKLESALLKYYLRMSSRCTPFGMFAACGVANPGSKGSTSNISIASQSGIRRHSRLDMHYLCSLSQFLSEMPEVMTQLTFYPNLSMYKIGNVWRYIEYYYQKGGRVHQISAVDQSPLLNAILKGSRSGINFRQFKALLLGIEESLGNEEILLFFKELVSSHVLMSELEPSITGDDFLCQILASIKKLEHSGSLQAMIGILEQVQFLLKEADHQSPGNGLVSIYKAITALLRKIDLEFEEGKLFQVDAFRELKEEAVVSEEICSKVDTAVEVLKLLTPRQPNDNIDNFCKRFRERYEDQEVPILQVLDIEAGIGYVHQNGEQVPLKVDIQASGRVFHWGKTEEYLHAKVMEAIKTGGLEIVIREAELADLKLKYSQQQPDLLSPSFSVMFREVQKEGDNDQKYIIIEHIGGSSASSLLARFAYNDKEICNHVKQVCDKEQSINKDIVFAEVIHLPQSRVGNILLHPPFRDKEIPYLGVSSLPAEDQILLQDIMVAVQHNKVILRSRSLNKEIIPRLSNAHNYSFNAQPVYHFLCDLQFQRINQGLFVNWGHLQYMYRFLPRIVYNNIILQPCQWNLAKSDFDRILDQQDVKKYDAFGEFCKVWNIPKLFVLSDGDNELPVYRENKMHVDVFLNTIKSRESITIKELLVDNSSFVADDKMQAYNCQFVLSYIKTVATYTSSVLSQHPLKINNDTRTFLPGSEWAFFKIYCGVKTTDEVLMKCVAPFLRKLKKLKKIDKWFFIRFADPDHHIRVRFHLTESRENGVKDITTLFLDFLSVYQRRGLIWKVSVDTYKREIERYQNMIGYVEDIFCYDSEAFLDFLNHDSRVENREDFRSMFALKSIDQLLEDFRFTIEDKINLVYTMSESFNSEFNIEKKEKVWLDSLFRKKSKEIENVVEGKMSSQTAAIYDIMEKRTRKLTPVLKLMLMHYTDKRAAEGKAEILFSCIHMLMNRICISGARYEEMVMYNTLYRYYKSKKARLKYS